MNKQAGLRAYVPPEVAKRWNQAQRDTWDKGTVARLLLNTGVPIVSTATIPIICYRYNLREQSETQEKIAMGMPVDEVHISDVITPDLLQGFMGAAIANPPFVIMSDDAYFKALVKALGILPKLDVLAVTIEQGDTMKRADAELSSGE